MVVTALKTFAELFERAPIGVAILDATGTIQIANEHLGQMLGVEDLVGHKLSAWIAEEDTVGFHHLRRRAFDAKKSLEIHLRVRAANDELLPVRLHLVPVAPGQGVLLIDEAGGEPTHTRERELRREFVHALMRAQDHERRHLARELHDEVGQSLAALDLGLTRLGQSKKASDVQNQVEALSDIVRRLGEEVRRVARGLYPAALDDLGLGPALELLAEENSVALGVPVSIELDDLDGLPGDVALVVYRVVQEALANALRHATPGRVQLSVKREDERLKIEVDDDGRGFSPHQTQGRGLGLRGMRERIEELHGSFAVTSRPGDGTLVTASIPCPEVKP